MTTNKKILIMTQIHPVNIAYVYDSIMEHFAQYNDIFSPQIMALLGEYSLKENENDLKHSYRVLNAAFVKNISAAINKMDPLKPWIIIGNCPKNNNIRLDRIIAFDGGKDFGDNDIFDRYIAEDNKMLADKDLQIDYYDLKNAEYTFTSMEHLKLFLSTIGYRKGISARGNTVQ